MAASRVWARCPRGCIEFEDLRSCGLVALMKWCEAHDETDEKRAFGSAYARVYGSILDELRTIDTMPRRSRFRAKAIRKLVEWETMTPEAIAGATGFTVVQVRETLRDMQRVFVPVDEVQVAIPKPSGLPLELLENIEEKDRVFLLRVLGEDGPAVIAAEMGLTQSRISQLKLALIRKYRVKLRALL